MTCLSLLTTCTSVNKLLVVLFLIATISTTRAESTARRTLWLERQKRETGEQQGRVVYGINSGKVQNNFGLIKPMGNGTSLDAGVSVVKASQLDQSQCFNNIHHAQSVYVVLPRWYEIENYQAPSIFQRTNGDRISSERSLVIQRMITFLKETNAVLTNQVHELDQRYSLSDVYEEPDNKKQELLNKLSVLIHKHRTLLSRLNHQQGRLNQFNSNDSEGLKDIFDRDLGHLTLVLEFEKLDILVLQNSFNN